MNLLSRRIRQSDNVSKLAQALAHMRFGLGIDNCAADCGSTASPGIDEVDEWRDWSDRPTTPDQARIENVMDRLPLHQRTILHIGVGNSNLARRFAPSAKRIDGISIQRSEIVRAEQMALSNYNAKLANKFDPSLCEQFHTRYDYIVDNNPSAFACCRRHFFTAMISYRFLLKTQGQLLTDRVGLGWCSTNVSQHWSLDFESFAYIGRLLLMQAHKLSKDVYSLKAETSISSVHRATTSFVRMLPRTLLVSVRGKSGAWQRRN